MAFWFSWLVTAGVGIESARPFGTRGAAKIRDRIYSFVMKGSER